MNQIYKRISIFFIIIATRICYTKNEDDSTNLHEVISKYIIPHIGTSSLQNNKNYDHVSQEVTHRTSNKYKFIFVANDNEDSVVDIMKIIKHILSHNAKIKHKIIPIDVKTLRQGHSEVSYDFKPKVQEQKQRLSKEPQREQRLRREQDERVVEIMKFLKPNMMSTRYIHEEVKRIQRTHEIRDDLRKMVWILERSVYKKYPLAKNVMICYRKHYKVVQETLDLWNHDTNNLLQWPIEDPFIN